MDLLLFSRRGMRAVLRGALRYVFGKTGSRRVRGWRLFFRLRVETVLHSELPIKAITTYRSARLWIDEEAFPRIFKLIRRARHTIIIQMFIWKDDETGRAMAEHLIAAADRGVKVDITKEATGDFFEAQQDFLWTKNSMRPLWRRFWSHPGIRVTYATHLDHAKVYVIDGKILLLTGMNVAEEYHRHWHDYLVELRDYRFVERFLSGGDVPDLSLTVKLVLNNESRRDVRPAVLDLLTNARSSIVLEQSYLSDPAVIDLLIRRSHDGVAVTVILPEKADIHQYANASAVSTLISKGKPGFLRVFFYPRMVHAKIIMADRKRAFIGSANMMTSSLDHMGEVNVLLEGEPRRMIVKLRDVIRADILQSKPVTSAPRLRWLGRWMAWMQL